jgi:CBS domain-containing protein
MQEPIMHRIRDILDEKGHEIFSTEPDRLVVDVIREMAEKGVGAILVLEDGDLRGMFSERDYARKIVLAGRSSRETTVREVMSRPVVTIDIRASAEEGLALMTRKRFRHLPVVDRGALVGLVSIGDLVNAVIGQQRQTIKELKRYVRGE